MLQRQFAGSSPCYSSKDNAIFPEDCGWLGHLSAALVMLRALPGAVGMVLEFAARNPDCEPWFRGIQNQLEPWPGMASVR